MALAQTGKNNSNETPLTAACSRTHSTLDVVRLLLKEGAVVTSKDYLSLWRNQAIPMWEKKAVHAALNEVAGDGFKRDEIRWIMMSS